MNVRFLTGLIALCLAFSTASYAGNHHAKAGKIAKAQKVRDNIYMLHIKGGNIAFLTGNEGVMMIDSDYTGNFGKINRAVRAITPEPIRYLITTHFHSDHTGANKEIGELNATIIGHKNVRKRMSTEQMVKLFKMKIPAADPIARPRITLDNSLTLHLNGQTAKLIHYPAAHTDGDTAIFFKEANVVHTGDLYFAGMYPFFDVDAGGNIKGILKALRNIYSRTDTTTKIIPGHGPLSDRKDLKATLKMMRAITKKVEKAIKKGQTLEQIKAKKFTAKYDKQFGGGFLNGDTFVTLVYQSLTKTN